MLNPTAADVLQLCTGERTVESIVDGAGAAIRPRGAGRRARGDELSHRHDRARPGPRRLMSEPFRPYTLVAELTYRCPLRCVYCSNPLDYARHSAELDTATWRRVFREAEDLGVVQLNLTGGEPLVRDDLEALIEEARRLDLYTNLITSGIPLRRERLARFRELGLDNVQISIQDVTAAASDRIAGLRSFERKLEVGGLGEGARLSPHPQHRSAPRQPRPRGGGHRPRRAAAGGSPGAGQHAVSRLGPRQSRRAAPHARPARARARRWRPGPGSGSAGAWRSCSSPPTTTPIFRRPAWTGGAAASSWSAPTASSCPVTPRTRSRVSVSRT